MDYVFYTLVFAGVVMVVFGMYCGVMGEIEWHRSMRAINEENARWEAMKKANGWK